MTSQQFFVTTMPPSRSADYNLGYLDGCIFLDFKTVDNNKICLIRISFDGYGCCELGNCAIPMPQKDSELFRDVVKDGVKDQAALETIVRRTISANEALIWPDALDQYGLK